jgi:recombination protein RecT
MGGLIQKQTQAAAAKNAPGAAMNEAGKQSVNSMLSTILDGEKMRKRFDEILGERTPQFLSTLTTMINGTPELKKCFFESPMSVVQSALKAVSFNLPIDPSLGYAYIVPFRNKKKLDDGSTTYAYEATFVLGWKGMHQLALRTGAYKTINVVDVHEGELKLYDRLTEEVEIDFIEDEEEREKTPIIGYMGYYRLVNGAEKAIFMTRKQIEAHEQKFRKGQYMGKGWRDDWDAMARKTVYRILIGKWGVMSVDYQTTKVAEQIERQIEDENATESMIYDENATAPVDTDIPSVSEEPNFDTDAPVEGAPF